jgi:hypothetical protein
VEHIAAAKGFLFADVTEKVMKGPARTGNDDVKAIDQLVLPAIPDRSHKLQAPEPLKPTNRFGSPEASLKHFVESRERTGEYLKNNNDLRAHAVAASDTPLGKQMDAVHRRTQRSPYQTDPGSEIGCEFPEELIV